MSSGPEILLACTDPSWQELTNSAKAMDREAVAKYGQRDRDHHLVCEQRSQFMRGYQLAQITTNIYGFCVCDTHNDGLGNMSGNGSAAFALEWARNWHATAPGRRAVIIGYMNAAQRAELDAAFAGAPQ